jgi:peptidoglycan/xylan/chitin deacetylase (PgdA/CDA1 family)
MGRDPDLSLSPGACLVVSYHYVRDTATTKFARVNALPISDFASQLSLLSRSLTLVDYDTVLEVVAGTRRLEQPAALLTFDDGLIDHYTTVFPVLRDHGAQGVFFVSPPGPLRPPVLNVQKTQLLLAKLGGEALLRDVEMMATRAGYVPEKHVVHPVLYRYDAEADRQVKQLLNYDLPYEIADPLLTTLFERHLGPQQDAAAELYLTEEMIREMSAAGMTFGFHTHRHRVLSRLSADRQREEIADGVDRIRGITGQATVPFCYPHGHAHAYNSATLDIVRDAGYSLAFTAVRSMAFPHADHRFELPRYDTCDLSAALGLIPTGPAPIGPRPVAR